MVMIPHTTRTTVRALPRNLEATRRIEAILRIRNLDLGEMTAAVDDVRKLPRDARERLVDARGDEFAAKALNPDGEPNAYGLEVEDLTDAYGLAWDG